MDSGANVFFFSSLLITVIFLSIFSYYSSSRKAGALVSSIGEGNGSELISAVASSIIPKRSKYFYLSSSKSLVFERPKY